MSGRGLTEVFADLPDPREARGVRHGLASVLTIAQCVVLAGTRTLLGSGSGRRMRTGTEPVNLFEAWLVGV